MQIRKTDLGQASASTKIFIDSQEMSIFHEIIYRRRLDFSPRKYFRLYVTKKKGKTPA